MGKKEQLALMKSNTESPQAADELKSWALVELFGHQRIVGFLSQQNFGTGILFRVDVPDLLKNKEVVRPGFTRYFGIGAIYGITPISEEMVRRFLPEITGLPDARPLSFNSYKEEENIPS